MQVEQLLEFFFTKWTVRTLPDQNIFCVDKCNVMHMMKINFNCKYTETHSKSASVSQEISWNHYEFLSEKLSPMLGRGQRGIQSMLVRIMKNLENKRKSVIIQLKWLTSWLLWFCPPRQTFCRNTRGTERVVSMTRWVWSRSCTQKSKSYGLPTSKINEWGEYVRLHKILNSVEKVTAIIHCFLYGRNKRHWINRSGHRLEQTKRSPFPHTKHNQTTEFTAQSINGLKKAIRQIHGRKVHQGLIKHTEVDPSSNLGLFKLQITEKNKKGC